MIAYIEGKIIGRGENWLVVKPEGLGVGYRVYGILKQVQNDNKISLFLHHHLREDSEELYGFQTKEELNFFELLLAASGVGPKMALNILSQLSVSQLKKCIGDNDSAVLTTVSGVGKKLAAKIIVELKSRLDKLDDLTLAGLSADNELLEALKTFGYKPAEISQVIGKIPPDLEKIEDKLKWCVKSMGRN